MSWRWTGLDEPTTVNIEQFSRHSTLDHQWPALYHDIRGQSVQLKLPVVFLQDRHSLPSCQLHDNHGGCDRHLHFCVLSGNHCSSVCSLVAICIELGWVRKADGGVRYHVPSFLFDFLGGTECNFCPLACNYYLGIWALPSSPILVHSFSSFSS